MMPVASLASVVLALLVKGAVVLALVAAAARVTRRSSAAVRHVAWAAGMLILLALPVLSTTLPEWVIASPAAGFIKQAGDGARFDAFSSAQAATNSDAGRTGDVVAPGTHRRDRAPSAAAAPEAGQPAGANESSWGARAAGLSWQALFVGTWAFGTVLSLCWLALISLRARRIRHDAVAMTAARWRDLLDVAVSEIAVARPVELLQSTAIAVPVTMGWRRPAVILPPDAEEWTDARARVVLLHELAHISRGDALLQRCAHLAAALHWVNPLVWTALARMRAEREHACDDMVLTCGAEPPEYAQHLLDIARGLATRRSVPVAGIAMARRSDLEGRLLAILDSARSRTAAAPRLLGAAGILMLVVAGPLAAVRFAPEADAFPLMNPAGGQADPPPAVPAPAATPGPEPLPAPSQGVTGGVHGGVSGGVVTDGRAGRRHEQQGSTLSPEARDRVVASLRNALHDSSADVRRQAIAALVKIDAPGLVDPMIAALHDADPGVRREAAEALGELGDQKAVDPLIAALRDSDEDVRESAASALGDLGSQRASTALATALRDASAAVREQAAAALGSLKDPSVAAAIARAAADVDADVRAQALRTLGELRVGDTIQTVINGLKDAAPEVREQAAAALAELASPASVDALTEALKDANAEVRQEVLRALSAIVAEHADHDRDRDGDVGTPPPPPRVRPVRPARPPRPPRTTTQPPPPPQ